MGAEQAGSRNTTFLVRFEGEIVGWLRNEARRELCSVAQMVRAVVGAEHRRHTGRRKGRVREPTMKLTEVGTKTTTLWASDRCDRDEVLKALVAVGGNRSEAARVLGVSRATLYRWFKKLGIVASEV